MNKNSGVVLILLGVALLAGVAMAASGSGWFEAGTLAGQPDTPTETTHGLDETGLAVAEGGPTCLDEKTVSRSGWVHLSGSGEDAAVSFDLTVAYRSGREVEMHLSNLGGNEYALQITTNESASTATESTKSEANRECTFVSRFEGSGLVPNVETLRVSVNGETIQTVHKKDSFAELRELPEPIRPGNVTRA